MTILRPQLTPSGYHETFGELRGLTGLRIVAAAWVVLFHFHFTPLPGVAEVVALLGPLLTAGALGVDLFFVLSGFVIAYTYLDQLGPALRAGATARFVWARACRLWPAYALVFHVFGLWLAARWYLGSDGEIAFQAVQPVLSVSEYVQQLFMVQLWGNPRFDGASWVGSTWSISAEWLAYLLFPVAALGLFRLRRLPAGVLGAGAVALMAPIAWSYLATGSPYFDWSWLVRILCGFGAGALAYLAVRRLSSPAAAPSAAMRTGASVLAAALPVLIAAGLLAGELLGPGRGGAVILLFPLLVGALAVADRGPALVLSAPWAVFGGRISYCLYLVHIPMLEIYWLALRKLDALGPTTWLAHLTGLAVVAATFGVAALAFRLVEEPARGWMRRLRPLSWWTGRRAGGGGVDMDPGCDHEPGPAFPAVPAPGWGSVGAGNAGGAARERAGAAASPSRRGGTPAMAGYPSGSGPAPRYPSGSEAAPRYPAGLAAASVRPNAGPAHPDRPTDPTSPSGPALPSVPPARPTDPISPSGPALPSVPPAGAGQPDLRPDPPPRPPGPASTGRNGQLLGEPAAPGPLLAAMVRADGRRAGRRIDLRVAEYLRVDFLHSGG